MEKTITVLHEGKWLKVLGIEVAHEGKIQKYELATAASTAPRFGAVRALPIVSNTHILLIASFRVPIGKFVLEFPSGAKDSKEESDEECVLRELKEETGYTGMVRGKAEYYRVPIISNKNTTYSMSGAPTIIVDIDPNENKEVLQDLDDAENIRVHQISIADAYNELEELKSKYHYVIEGSVQSVIAALQLKKAMINGLLK